MPSLHEPERAGLESSLRTILPQSEVIDVRPDPGGEPLVLLRTDHVVAGFGISNGNARAVYDTLYRGFKKCTAERQDQWGTRDLAFVLCVPPQTPNLDHLCSSLETDIYFCRKFVVPMVSPWSLALSRLPFLPLTPIHGDSLRPPSAQTLLQKSGVPAALAKYIVVRQQRSAAGIIEDSIGGDFGEPRKLGREVVVGAIAIERVATHLRLETVTVENFRAYRKPQTFTLGKHITVLYGPNGFGKTSFFDAVDFAATGGVGRIEGTTSDAHFRKLVQHLDSGPEEGKVSLGFTQDGLRRRLVRSVKTPKQALLDDNTADRKAVLIELTGGDIGVSDRVENFVNLFRATHLFSQEQQELTRNFRDSCQLSSEIVSRMLAFEDYTNAVNKASEVVALLNNTIDGCERQASELAQQIATDKLGLEQLSKIAESHVEPNSLRKEVEAVKQELGRLEIEASEKDPDAAVLRGWRAPLEAKIAESDARAKRLSTVTKAVVELRSLQSSMADLQTRLKDAEQQAVSQVKSSTSEEELRHAERLVVSRRERREHFQRQITALEWAITNKPHLEQLRKQEAALQSEMSELSAKRKAEAEEEQRAAAKVRQLSAGCDRLSQSLLTKRSKLVELGGLRDRCSEWSDRRGKQDKLLDAQRDAAASLSVAKSEQAELLRQKRGAEVEIKTLSRAIADFDESNDELKQVLSDLQGHVTSGTCPLCGEDHGSKANLIKRISKRVAADAMSDSRAKLSAVRERLKKTETRLADKRPAIETLVARIAEIKESRRETTEFIEAFEVELRKFEIALGAKSPDPEQQLHERTTALSDELASIQRDLDHKRREVRDEIKTHENLASALSTTSRKIESATARLADVRDHVGRIKDDPRWAGAGGDKKIDGFDALLRASKGKLESATAELTEAEQKAAVARAKAQRERQELSAVKARGTSVRTDIAGLRGRVAEINEQIRGAGLAANATEQEVQTRVELEAREHVRLRSLRDTLASLEIALDAATTAAALGQLKQGLRAKERLRKAAIDKKALHEPWVGYFDGLARIVSSQRNEAIERFTREYGPRTSIIQRRLRAVYGFDDIEIQSRESTITVSVKRRGEELRPIDYFSQSQQQTLLLGLFLTACSSQTWSAFSPIFLDDPVTHFDDLNTYAFLDLLIGLLESDIGQRQFVVSTCDEKLLQLARQKFRHLGDGAKFYRFSALSEAGPVVTEMGA